MIIHHLGFMRTGKEHANQYDRLRNRAWKLQRKAMGPIRYHHKYDQICSKQRSLYLQDPAYWRVSNKANLNMLDQHDAKKKNTKMIHIISVDTKAWINNCFQSKLPTILIQKVQQLQLSHSSWKVILWTNELVTELFPNLQPLLNNKLISEWISTILRYHIL
jgi:hypothetical protein